VTIQNVGHYTFQEAFDRTGRIINITVAPVNNFDPPRLLNYLTAPHVCIWSAAVASCAIPGEQQPPRALLTNGIFLTHLTNFADACACACLPACLCVSVFLCL
jgi:hypothetical protein